jgi:hypothetical protein
MILSSSRPCFKRQSRRLLSSHHPCSRVRKSLNVKTNIIASQNTPAVAANRMSEPELLSPMKNRMTSVAFTTAIDRATGAFHEPKGR